MSDATGTTGGGPEKKRQKVSDPEEFNQQRRLRSIHDARDNARETYLATQDPSIDVGYQTLAANLRAAVQNYISEIEGLLINFDFDGNDDVEADYWEEHDLGPITIPPPEELRELRDSPNVTVIGDADLNPQSYNLPGLKGYLEAQCPFQESFILPVRQRHKGQETVQATVTMEMPIDVSYNAYRVANRFLTHVGIDVEMESGMNEFGFDEVTPE